MSEFNFKSAICTSRSQSERLLALGLKKETADMCSVIDHVSDSGKWEEVDTIFSFTPDDWNFRESVTPRWSLHRLVSLTNPDDIKIACNEKHCWGGKVLKIAQRKAFEKDNLYDNIVDCIEWLIKEGYFPKEYLV